MKIDGNKANNTGSIRCIDFSTVSNAIIENVWTINGNQHNIALGAGGASHNITIQNIITDNSGGSGIISSNNSYNIICNNIISNNNTGTGVYFTNSDKSSMNNINSYDNTAYGIDVFDSDHVTCTNIIAVHNQDGMHIEDSTYVIMEGISYLSTRDGIGIYYTAKATKHITLKCELNTNSHYGINIRPDVQYINIHNSHINNNTGYGIYIQDADYCNMNNCTIIDNGGAYNSIRINGATGGKAIHNRIKNCIISGCAYAIRSMTHAEHTIVQNNKVSGTTAAISLVDADKIIINNTGFNPVGAVGPPAVPATTVNYTNAYGYPCQVQVYGGTVTEIDLDDIAIGLTSGIFIIPPGGTINITYSAAPSWRWWGL